MGELLAVLFIGTLFVASGLILAFTAQDKGRKLGMALLGIGLFVYLVCFLFYPNSERYRI
ncbi:hypothetical protein GCM10023093_18120 [Nemorincola caseinilytica]|uniref:DUF2759 domain-containing protein n=1 Tax=Nemorincola caseinilytica TaxID=2054315 RepID=A0ABP8NGY1_9BACT